MTRVTVAQTWGTRQSTWAPLAVCCAMTTKYLSLLIEQWYYTKTWAALTAYHLLWRFSPPVIHPLWHLWSVWWCVGWVPSPAGWLNEGFHTSRWTCTSPLPENRVQKNDQTLKRTNDSLNTEYCSTTTAKKNSPVCVHTPTQHFPNTQVWGHQWNS